MYFIGEENRGAQKKEGTQSFGEKGARTAGETEECSRICKSSRG